jgi:hypothetical protein
LARGYSGYAGNQNRYESREREPFLIVELALLWSNIHLTGCGFSADQRPDQKTKKENKMKKIAWALILGLLVAGGAQAALLYSDTFDNDGLDTNTGTGGGATQTTGGGTWSDDGDATYNNTGTGYADSSLLYSVNSFQSDGGFELTVNYTCDSVATFGRNLFGFGLLADASSWTATDDDNPFAEQAAVYSIGVNLIDESGVPVGLNFADGSTVTTLDSDAIGAGTDRELVIRVEDDGNGGAEWTLSIDGTKEGSGNIASFDFTKSFSFAAYGQDDERTKVINSVSLTSIPEPATIGMLGLGAIVMLAIRKHQRG